MASTVRPGFPQTIPLAIAPVAGMEPRTQEDDVSVDLDAGLALGLFHVRGRDVFGVADLAEIEAHRLAHEQVERHFVDRRSVRTDVTECVDMRSDMVEHADEAGLECHRIAQDAETERLRRLVRERGQIDGALKELVSL